MAETAPSQKALLSQSVENHVHGYHPLNITQLMSTNGKIATSSCAWDHYPVSPGPRVLSLSHSSSSGLLVTWWCSHCHADWELSGVMQGTPCLEAPRGRTGLHGSQTRHSWVPLHFSAPHSGCRTASPLCHSGSSAPDRSSQPLSPPSQGPAPVSPLLSNCFVQPNTLVASASCLRWTLLPPFNAAWPP